MKILVDTDIGSALDDAVCLAYLLAQPQAELVGITTVSGQPHLRARLCSALCKAAGKDIPIYPGSERPLLVSLLQADVPQAKALTGWAHETAFPEGEAVEFMRCTIRQHPGEITLLAIGPLTNIAQLFMADPEIPSLLRQVVCMSGTFLTSDTLPEWNVMLDPHAAAQVYESDLADFRILGLNVTTQITLSDVDIQERFSTPILKPVRDFARMGWHLLGYQTLHDALAAVTLFDEQICVYERGWASICLERGRSFGRSDWTPDPAGQHSVAADVDEKRFFEYFFSVF